jgi:cytochrome P450
MTPRVNLMAPEIRANPYPFYAEMRRSGAPVEVDPGGLWAVSRHEDVAFILKSPEVFSSRGFKAAWQPPWLEYNPLAESMLALDGPAHARLRALVTGAFGPRAIARLEPRIRALAGELADDLAARGEADFIAGFALPLPAFVIGELLGFDLARRHHFKRWADDLISVTPVPESPEHAARVRATVAELTSYLSEIIAARRAEPADDMMSDLIRAEAFGQSLTDAELISFLLLLLLGGFDTTTYLLANSLRLLAERPAEMALLRADPFLVSKFVEEILRYDPPVHGLPRITTSAITMKGVPIPPGALVVALIGSANRDERLYPDPDRFDLHRGQAAITFGHGIHACLGSVLARLEARLSLEALLARFRAFAPVPCELEWNRSLTVRGMQSLPLRFIQV